MLTSSPPGEAHAAVSAAEGESRALPSADVARGGSGPATARRAQPPLLSVALPPTAAITAAEWDVRGHTAPPPPPPEAKADVQHPSLTASRSSANTPSAGGITASVAAAPVNTIPVLQLPCYTCEDAIAPVRTLYTRLFHEAEEREQRHRRAAQQRHLAQQQREKEQCTFRPRVAPTRESAEPAAMAHRRSSSARSPAKDASAVEEAGAREPTPAADDATYERLYRNSTEQAERRARRLQALRDAQEAELQANCTFRPSVSPAASGRRGRSSSARRTRLHEDETGREEEKDGAAGAGAPRRATSASAARRTPSRSWKQFLTAQDEMQATQERHLAELRQRAAEESRPRLYTGVPRSKASRHLRTYLETEKGYKGPIEGWSERFASYMKTKTAQAPATATTDAPPRVNAEDHTVLDDTSPPRTSAEPRRARSNRRTTTAATPHPVFERLFHDGEERVAVRELLQLMRQDREHKELYQPNASRTDAAAAESSGAAAGVATSAGRTPRGGPRRSSSSSAAVAAAAAAAAARTTCSATPEDTAAAIALATGGTAPLERSASHGSGTTPPPTAPLSVFDALYAEQQELQRRREVRHLQAENDAETFTFRPAVSQRSRTLAEERARRQSQSGGSAGESVRERRARAAAEAAALEAASRAQVQFSYSTFAHRQAERDRRRQEELLTVLLNERSGVVGECRFRPALSEVTEAIAGTQCNYAQLIDHPETLRHLDGSGATRLATAATTPSSTNGAGATGARASRDAPWLPHRSSLRRPNGSVTAQSAGSSAPTASQNAAESVVGGEERRGVVHSASPLESQRWRGNGCVMVDAVESAAKPATAPGQQQQQQQQRSPRVRSHDSTPGAFTRNDAGWSSGDLPRVLDDDGTGHKGTDATSMHIAGAASSTYLRQLESELQEALMDWSQCV
ncbi:hypothetical protein NESM_000264500 [Novymonas esmeraldas]|uniref:Uncharacterized protein n=1 Tax=Novymonas esmeraldas TaxID=1808958 RepID=A0AAW0FB40_9TRYP